ncbi:MAG TPA: 50S ribosomal protein L24 [Candidatus Bathyarchaeia archaeon]
MQTVKPVTKPSKQRRMVFQAPNHVRYKLFAAHLSPELRANHGTRGLPVRTGDTVRILRGDHKGFEGKITRVDRKRYRVYVEGLTREKVDGTAKFVPIHPSKIMITKLTLDDKWRKKILERKKGVPKKAEKVAEKKPRKKVVAAKEEVAEEKVTAEAKPLEKKPKPRKKRKVAEKPAAEKTEAKVEEEKPKARKTRAKRKTKEKTEGGE